MNKRRKMVLMSPELVAALCKSTGDDCMILSVNGVPDDAKFVAAEYSLLENCFLVIFTHSSFDEIETGERAPEKFVTFTRYIT